MNALTTTTPAEQFRAKAASLMTDTAAMTLHQIVDEFQRLSGVMDENLVKSEDRYTELNEVGELAKRERNLVVGAARARFGLSLETWDRPCDGNTGPW